MLVVINFLFGFLPPTPVCRLKPEILTRGFIFFPENKKMCENARKYKFQVSSSKFQVDFDSTLKPDSGARLRVKFEIIEKSWNKTEGARNNILNFKEI